MFSGASAPKITSASYWALRSKYLCGLSSLRSVTTRELSTNFIPFFLYLNKLMYRTLKSKLLWVRVTLALDLLGFTWCAWLGCWCASALPYPPRFDSVEHDVPLDAAPHLLLHFCCNRCLLLPRLFPLNYWEPGIQHVLLVSMAKGNLHEGRGLYDTEMLIQSTEIQKLDSMVREWDRIQRGERKAE